MSFPLCFPLQEGRAYGLDLDILLLGDAEHALPGEVVAHLLHEALEVVVVVGHSHLVCLGPFAAAPVQFALVLAEVAVVALGKILVEDLVMFHMSRLNGSSDLGVTVGTEFYLSNIGLVIIV